jgi:hypothetical protein
MSMFMRGCKNIKDMKPGESGYTVPWALYITTDGKYFLNGNYTIVGAKCGTASMIITRYLYPDCWGVDVRECEYTFEAYDSVPRFATIPVPIVIDYEGKE